MAYLDNKWCFHIMDDASESIMALLEWCFKHRWCIHAPKCSIPLPGAPYPPFRISVHLSGDPLLSLMVHSFAHAPLSSKCSIELNCFHKNAPNALITFNT
uniref:Uncharacterized protein n=1 Tax=Lactuca sativa TaxID=4236 RepID=A0A9R1WXC9_LACSA|nr:hypothetical protein LSAT_V11C900476510 [Lactuca sativa]